MALATATAVFFAGLFFAADAATGESSKAAVRARTPVAVRDLAFMAVSSRSDL
jgi:hypothetical protein